MPGLLTALQTTRGLWEDSGTDDGLTTEQTMSRRWADNGEDDGLTMKLTTKLTMIEAY